MGIDTRMRALFRRVLRPEQVVSFVRWADDTFEDTGFFHTASAFHGEGATLLALDWEYVEPEQSDAFEAFARSLAKQAKCAVAVFFDLGDGPFGDLEELEALCEELELDADWVERPDHTECWSPLDPETGRVVAPPEEVVEPPKPAVVERVRLEATPQRLLGALAELPDEVKVAVVDELEFSRDELGRFTRLLVRYHGGRKLGPWLEVLRGHVRHVTVAERYDVEEVRDGLDLSVHIEGERNPFLD